jgi:hypothetical protein
MTTRASAALLEIMADTDAPSRRRIEATEGLLAYEAPEKPLSRPRPSSRPFLRMLIST